MRKIFFAALFLIASIGGASAQSACPYIAFGAVLTAAQWQQCFQNKADATGAPFLPLGGGTLNGPLVTAASAAGGAGFNLPPGAAPTSPNNGDVWVTSAGFYVQVNGASVGIPSLPLNMANGGTNASLTANAGGIVYSTASAFGILDNPNSNGLCLLSGTIAPSFGSCTSSAAVASVANSDGTLTISPTTGAVVASLALGHANTWTAKQTFTNSDIALLGSSTGATTFTSANASASNYTLTLPAVNDALAVLGTAQTFSATETFSGALNVSGTFELGGNTALAAAVTAPTGPTGTDTGTPGLMMGIGKGTGACTLTPVYSTMIEITIDGWVENTTSGTATMLGQRYGTGTAPSNGAAPTGTVLGAPIPRAKMAAAEAGQYVPFSMTGIATGLSVGTPYWFDIQLYVIDGTGSVGGITCTMHETF